MSQRPFCAAFIAAALSCVLPQNAKADISDYEFRLVSQTVTRSDAVVIDVQLINRNTQEPVSGAIVFASRLDMAPDNMETMTAPLEAAPNMQAGIYRFTASLAMAGGWRLSLAAKIQGEAGTLESRLVFQAVDR